MRTIVLLGIVFWFKGFVSLAHETGNGLRKQSGEPVLSLAWKVISDEYDAKIPKGKYALEGKVLNNTSGKGISGVSITDLKNELGKSLKTGGFSILIPIDRTQIAFVKKDYKNSYFEEYELKEQHRIKIEIYIVGKKKEKEYAKEKPVIYCYSDHPVQVKLDLKTEEELFFAYPGFSEGTSWNFSVSPGKLLQTAEGKEVPYLFWESKSTKEIDFGRSNNQGEGQVVARENVVSFLDSTLTFLHFSPTEKTDFISYWGPRMIAEPYVFVHFFQDGQCEQFAHYEVSPEPDAFYRLFMVFSPSGMCPETLNLKKQELVPMERTGFHLLEWGGIEYQPELTELSELDHH